jgi:hypothetical protein
MFSRRGFLTCLPLAAIGAKCAARPDFGVWLTDAQREHFFCSELPVRNRVFFEGLNGDRIEVTDFRQTAG